MFCTHCGASNPDHASFCSACGKRIAVLPTQTSAVAPPTEAYSAAPNIELPRMECKRTKERFVRRVPRA
jgi:hypothetical protein